jgi:hypothetical protein
MQGILVFASEAARNSAITSPQEGQFAFTKDNNSLWYYTGSAWVASGATGDIEGVTAGVGISGGGTSGTVTITNDMATTITASGDIVVGTGSGTYDNLPIGTTGQVLTADTTVSPYKVKWASTSDTNDFKLIDNSTFSAVTSFSRDNVFSATYDIYKIYIRGISSSGLNWSMRFRSGGTDTSTNYVTQRLYAYNTTVGAQRMGNTAEISAFPIESTSDAFMEITIVNPYATTKTTGFSTDGTNGESIYYATFQQTGTTSFDGYKFLSGGSETITGEQWVYGLKV